MLTPDDGTEAVSQGNLQQARLIFESILQENPHSIEALLGLANVLMDTDKKRACYEKMLSLDKDNKRARDGLRNLEPQPDPLRTVLIPHATPETGDNPGPDNDESTPPIIVWIAIGLALSVLLFSVGTVVVYLLFNSLAGGG